MIINDISFDDPQENLTYDEELLKSAEVGKEGEVLRFWESPVPFIVLGRISKEDDDVDIEAAEKDNVPILRRASGGGTVVQGPGCLNFTFVLSKERKEINDLKKSYEWILNHVIEALDDCGIKSKFFPISDLALEENNKKFSGNAQKRGRKYILHHGTILYNFNLSLIDRYLKYPKETPDYRNGRSHSNFVTNLTISIDDIKMSFQNIKKRC